MAAVAYKGNTILLVQVSEGTPDTDAEFHYIIYNSRDKPIMENGEVKKFGSIFSSQNHIDDI